VKLFVENWKMGLEFLLGGDCVCFLFLFGLFVYLKEGGSSFSFGFGQIKQSIEGDWRLTVKWKYATKKGPKQSRPAKVSKFANNFVLI